MVLFFFFVTDNEDGYVNDYVNSSDCLYVECIMDSTVRNTSLKVQVFRKVTSRRLEVTPTWCSRDTNSLRAGRYGDQIPVGAKFSALVRTSPGAHPTSYTMGTGSFSGVKRPGRGLKHQPPSSAEVKEIVLNLSFSLQNIKRTPRLDLRDLF